jgi:two-component system, OmpR family, KDP operon response regulator KdpE
MSGPGPRVLVADDDPAVRRLLRTSLKGAGFSVFEAGSAGAVPMAVAAVRPDAMILDLGLPGGSGIDVIREIRKSVQIPILILSVREEEAEKVAALDAGADDFLTKPFGIAELLARLRVCLRHAVSGEGGTPFHARDLTVDLSQRLVTVAGRPVQLTPTEYDILKALIAARGNVLTSQQLLRQVWGLGYRTELHMLRVNISNLRLKLEQDPSRPVHIVTEPGVGYRLRVAD